jgi:hypothetical protein
MSVMTDQEATDYLHEELIKLDAPITYTACKVLITRIRKPPSSQDKRIEALEAALENAARIADSFTCGVCGMDGKSGAAIREGTC